MQLKFIVSIILLTLLAVGSVSPQHHESSSGKTGGVVDLGKIDFPTSGLPAARKHFVDGVLLLHSFEYPRAKKAFAEASRIDPGFAMAYWGEAMTYDHPIWGEQDRASALAALVRLAPTAAERRGRKAGTEREKMFLDAVEKLYADGDRRQNAAAYSDAMAELAKRFPDDHEAQAFYSLSLLGLKGVDRDTENYMRAAAVAESIYQKNPNHPGALHYLIHSYDDPIHPPLGLRAARAYGTVARSAAHAQHMPSHIFFALGMWDDSIVTNIASLKTSRDEGTRGHHALHWLLHAYFQIGREDEAAKLLAMIEEDAKNDKSRPVQIYLASSRATMLVENRGKGPATMMVPAEAVSQRFGALSSHEMAIGLEYVRRNDLAEARRVFEGLRIRHSVIRATRSNAGSGNTVTAPADVDSGAVMELILDSAIQFASGNREDGLRKIVAAGEAEDKLIFEFGPPVIAKPAWEAAGEMLLAAGKKTKQPERFATL